MKQFLSNKQRSKYTSCLFNFAHDWPRILKMLNGLLFNVFLGQILLWQKDLSVLKFCHFLPTKFLPITTVAEVQGLSLYCCTITICL